MNTVFDFLKNLTISLQFHYEDRNMEALSQVIASFVFEGLHAKVWLLSIELDFILEQLRCVKCFHFVAFHMALCACSVDFLSTFVAFLLHERV
jgi:hypothetical protein